MTNRKTTKRALLGSVLALVLCFAMLLGSTYAWFTDKEVTGVAKMTAGELDIELTVWNAETQKYDAAENYKLFSTNKDGETNILWEPGYVLVEVLKVENLGNLNLTWTAKLVDTTTQEEVTDLSAKDLTEALTVYTKENVDPAMLAQRPTFDNTWKAASFNEFVKGVEKATVDFLAPNEAQTLAIAIKMNENAGNEFQNAVFNGENYQLVIVATQTPAEVDDFDKNYDFINIVDGIDASSNTVEFVEYPQAPVSTDASGNPVNP